MCLTGIIVRAARKVEPIDLLQVLHGEEAPPESDGDLGVLPVCWLANDAVISFFRHLILMIGYRGSDVRRVFLMRGSLKYSSTHMALRA